MNNAFTRTVPRRAAGDPHVPSTTCRLDEPPPSPARRWTGFGLCLASAGLLLWRSLTFDFGDPLGNDAGTVPASLCVGMAIMLMLLAFSTLAGKPDVGPS